MREGEEEREALGRGYRKGKQSLRGGGGGGEKGGKGGGQAEGGRKRRYLFLSYIFACRFRSFFPSSSSDCFGQKLVKVERPQHLCNNVQFAKSLQVNKCQSVKEKKQQQQ